MSANKDELKREMRLFSTISVLVGTVIDSGVFTVPGKIVASTDSIDPTILAWLIAGVGAVLCALVYVGLSSAMPEAGGSYVYTDKAFGHHAFFVYGWSMISGLLFPVMIMMASVLASNLAILFPGLNSSATGKRLVVATLILILAGVNLLGVRNDSVVRNIFTVAEVTILIIASVGGSFALKSESFTTMTTGTVEWENSFAIAVPVLAAAGGYYILSYISGEIKNPKRNLSFATITDVGIAIIINILLTVACVGSVGFVSLAGSMTPIGDTAQTAFGSFGAVLITPGTIVSIFGSTNGTLLSFLHVVYAIAENRMMFSFLSKLHPKCRTPYTTILVHAAGAVVFMWTGSFMTFLMMNTFVGCPSEVAICLSLLVPRKKQPDTGRLFKMWRYLVTAILATVTTMIFAYSVSIQEIVSGSLSMLAPIPAYSIFLYTRNRKQSSTADQ